MLAVLAARKVEDSGSGTRKEECMKEDTPSPSQPSRILSYITSGRTALLQRAIGKYSE